MYVTPWFYAGGDVGLGINSGRQKDDYAVYSGSMVHFVYSPCLGLNLVRGLDVSLLFEDYVRFAGIKQFAVKSAYQISLSKKR
jgi:hypothetical protein